MDGYGYPYAPGFQEFQGMRPPENQYLDHGDGYGEYYGMGPVAEDLGRRSNRSKHQTHRSRSGSGSRKSHSRSRSRSKSRSVSSRSRSNSRRRDVGFKEPGFLDAFRVLYLTPSKHRKNNSKYLATKKKQDRIQEYLKSDGLGSKRWLFYPRSNKSDPGEEAGPKESRETCDQRVKVDADFFHKYKRSRKVDDDAPIRKLRRWELILYKKLGFVQAV